MYKYKAAGARAARPDTTKVTVGGNDATKRERMPRVKARTIVEGRLYELNPLTYKIIRRVRQ